MIPKITPKRPKKYNKIIKLNYPDPITKIAKITLNRPKKIILIQ